MYELLLAIGGIGLVVMVMLGAVHVGGHHGGHAIGDAGHGHGGGHALGGSAHTHGGGHALGHAGHGTHGAADAGGHGHTSHPAQVQQDAEVLTHPGGVGPNFLFRFLPSPVDIFSLVLGAGATGMLLQSSLSPLLTGLAAVAGGLVFDFGISRQVFKLVSKFASKPSEGLEGQVAHTAKAISRFDDKGQGLVCVTLDDQLVQLLARLEPEELQNGVEVHKDDVLLVLDVDPKKGTCLVSKEFGP